MTISTTDSSIRYNGNGVTLAFPVPYRFLLNGDISTLLRSSAGVVAPLMEGTHYTLTGAGNDEGGTLTMLVAPAVGETLIIDRIVALTQETDYPEGGNFPAEAHERALDRLTMITQQQETSLGYCLTLPDRETADPLPPVSERASRLLGFDALGRVFMYAASMLGSVAEFAVTLASPAGSSLVGFVQSGVGAIPRTLQSKNRERYSILDFGENTVPGVTDMSPALNAARSQAAGRLIEIPAGHFKFNDICTGVNDLLIDGDGDTTILDFSGVPAADVYALEAIGTATQIEELSGTQVIGLHTVTFASAPSLSVGDVFVIFNPTTYSYSGFREDYHAGEWCEVESISGAVVTTRNQLYDTYEAADVDVYKITGPKVRVMNCKIIGGANIKGLIHTKFCIDPLVDKVTGDHANNSCIFYDRCYRPVTNTPHLENVGDGGDDYGIVYGNTQHGRINGGYIYGRRHAVTKGGDEGICAVPCRDLITTSALLKNDPASNVSTADFHGNVEASRYVDCTIYGGVNWQGKNNGYDNCRIYADGLGRVLLSAEIKGGNFHLRGCDLFTYENPILNTRGIIDIGNNNNAVTALTTEDCTFIVDGNTLNGKNLSTSTNFVMFRNAGSTQKMNFSVQGNTANVDALQGILRTNLASGTAASDFIIVDENVGFKPSEQVGAVFLHLAVGSHYANFPHRCQAQSGREILTALNGTNLKIGTPAVFPYIYPRAPDGQAGGELGFAGTAAVLIGIGATSTTGVTPRLIAGVSSGWTADRTVTAHWIVSLDEV